MSLEGLPQPNLEAKQLQKIMDTMAEIIGSRELKSHLRLGENFGGGGWQLDLYDKYEKEGREKALEYVLDIDVVVPTVLDDTEQIKIPVTAKLHDLFDAAQRNGQDSATLQDKLWPFLEQLHARDSAGKTSQDELDKMELAEEHDDIIESLLDHILVKVKVHPSYRGEYKGRVGKMEEAWLQSFQAASHMEPDFWEDEARPDPFEPDPNDAEAPVGPALAFSIHYADSDQELETTHDWKKEPLRLASIITKDEARKIDEQI